jgi:hypothetical protein
MLRTMPEVTVHLDSGVDVVIVEGGFAGQTKAQPLYGRYNEKCGWNYSTDEYGPLTTIPVHGVGVAQYWVGG